MTKKDSFINLFKFLRERSGLSAHKLSEEAGLSGAYVSRLESGSLSPSVEALAKLIQVLNPTPEELFILVQSFVYPGESEQP